MQRKQIVFISPVLSDRFMKKLNIILFLILSCGFTNAQLLNSFGFNAGVTMADHIWRVATPSNQLVPYYYDDAQKWVYNYNLAVFAEFFQNDHFRWDSEIQYNHKGSIDVDKTHKNANLKTTTTQLCWNNYLKIRYELYQGVPYLLLGIRLEDVLSTASASPPVERGAFYKLQVTPAAGAGWEFITYGSIKPFVELIYNPSPLIGPPSYHVDNLTLYNRALELRVGIRIELQGKETCPKVYK